MKIKTSVIVIALVVAAGWFAVASAGTLKSPSLAVYQVAQNDQGEYHQGQPERDQNQRQQAQPEHNRNQRRQVQPAHREKNPGDEWYQGQRGHWYNENNRWEWRGTTGDDWYQGQRGHWYRESNGWQFGSAGMICNNRGCNCHVGGYIPANGEGMVSRNRPNLFWQCDSDGHNCHWARRPRCY